MREFRMLKIVAMAGACILALSACGAVRNLDLGEIHYRTEHLRFEKQEYEKFPGVLMRASVGAWGRYDEAARMAAIVDYYIDPEQRLKPESLRFKWGSALDEALDSLSGSEFEIPDPQELSGLEAQKRVQCLNELYGEISGKYRELLLARYALFKVEAQCSAFLARNPIPKECIGWKLSASRETHEVGSGVVIASRLTGNVIDKCAS